MFTKDLAKFMKYISCCFLYLLLFKLCLVFVYNMELYHSIGKKPINADYYALIDKIETNLKAPKFKVNE